MTSLNECRLSLIILLMFLPFLCFAQTREDALRQMSVGDYNSAVIIYEALEATYPGRYAADLNKAKTCKNLQESAEYKFSIEHFTEAENLYKQIMSHNPSDRTTVRNIMRCQRSRDDFLTRKLAKCTTVEQLKQFSARYPKTPQAKEAEKRVKELSGDKANEGEIENQEIVAWNIADNNGEGGTIESYENYIKRGDTTIAHIGEAHCKMARLYYMQGDYSSARFQYRIAKAYNCLWRADEPKLSICEIEIMFKNLGGAPTSNQLSEYVKSANDLKYLYSSKIEDHLHLPEVRALQIWAFCNEGKSKDAKNIVKLYYPDISSPEYSSEDWTKSDWMKYIRRNCKR